MEATELAAGTSNPGVVKTDKGDIVSNVLTSLLLAATVAGLVRLFLHVMELEERVATLERKTEAEARRAIRPPVCRSNPARDEDDYDDLNGSETDVCAEAGVLSLPDVPMMSPPDTVAGAVTRALGRDEEEDVEQEEMQWDRQGVLEEEEVEEEEAPP
jgi:hypothetical protein